MKRGKDILWITTPFNMRQPRRDTKDRAGGENDLRTAMNFVLVNQRALRRPSCCAACSLPLQRSYLRDLSTHSRYCSVECYPGHAAGSLAEADPFGFVVLFVVLPKLAIDVVSAVFNCAWRD